MNADVHGVVDTCVSALAEAGMSRHELDAKALLFANAVAAHGARADDARCWWVPGRVEVLGKHTDYAGGRSLLCAAELGLAMAVIPRTDRVLRVIDVTSGDRAEAELSPSLAAPRGHWSTYPFTVASRVALNFSGALHGADIAFASDLPQAAGMSSSSALVVATFLALSTVNDLASRPEYRDIADLDRLAEYLGAVENGRSYGALFGDRGVGTAGGSEDHTAILAARSNALSQYRFAPSRFERAVPFPADRVLVIGVSGVRAEKAGGAMADYNRAAARAAAVLEAWRTATGSSALTLAAALDECGGVAEPLERAIPDAGHATFSRRSLAGRLCQFRNESLEIIPSATDALARGDVAAFGALVDRSQAGAEAFLENQIPETMALARTARALGAEAASAFGAGFGGSVYALVPTAEVDAFIGRWAREYRSRFPARADASRFFATAAGPAAVRIER